MSYTSLVARVSARRVARIASSVREAEPLWRWPPAPLDPAARARTGLPHDSRFAFAIDLAVRARRGDTQAAHDLRYAIDSWLALHPLGFIEHAAAERVQAWLVVRDLLPSLRVLLHAPLLRHAVFLERHADRTRLEDAVALLLLGCAFEGPAPRRWRSTAARRLERDLQKTILPDGVVVERSPMRHLQVLEALLSALWASGRRDLPVSVPLASVVRQMQSVARTYLHPDGDIPLFHGSVLGVAPLPSQLIGPSTAPAPDRLPWSGYLRLALDHGVLLACGSEFELSLGTQRILVAGSLGLRTRTERSFDAFPGHGWRILQTAFGSRPGASVLELRLYPSLRFRLAGTDWHVRDAHDALLLLIRPIGRPEVSSGAGVVRFRRSGRRPFVFGCWLLLPGAEPTPG